MKKIIMMLFLLVNVLLFFNIRDVYKEKDLSDILNFQTLQPDLVNVSLVINNNDSEMDSQAVFETFRYIAQRYNMMITYNEYNFDRDEYITYIVAAVPIDQRLELVTEQSLNFNEQDNHFYVNQKGVENGIYFYLLNQRLDVKIYPMTSMEEIRSGEYTFIADSQEALDEIVEIFMEEFGSYVDSTLEFDSEPFDLESEINGFLSPIISATMVLIFLILIMYIHIYSKKIAIFKTFGMSFWVLMKHLLLPLFAMIVLTIAVTYSLLFFIFISTINPRTIPIIWTLVNSGWYQLIGVAITMIISYFLLTFIPTYSLLKSSNINRFLMEANYVIKIVVLVLLLPFVSGRIELIQNDIRMINHVNYYANNDSLDTTYQFTQAFQPRYRYDGYARLFEELDFDNLDPDIIYSNELLYEYHRAYHILNHAGAIFCSGTLSWEGRPELIVNENYLAKHPIRDVDGNWIDLDQIEAEVVHLVPKILIDKYNKDDFISDSFASIYKTEIIVIDNEQTVFDYSLSWDYFGIPELPYSIMVYRDLSFRLDASIFNFVFINDINELLRDTPFYDKIMISTVIDELYQIQEWSLNDLMDNMMVMIPSFALVLLIIIQYAYLYLKVYKKRIYAKKLMGHHPLRIFSRLLIESGIAVIASIIIAWYAGLDFKLLIAVIGLDIFVYLAVVAISQWKHSLVLDYYE